MESDLIRRTVVDSRGPGHSPESGKPTVQLLVSAAAMPGCDARCSAEFAVLDQGDAACGRRPGISARAPRLLPILLPGRWTRRVPCGQLWNVRPAHGPQRTVLDDVPTPTDQMSAPPPRASDTSSSARKTSVMSTTPTRPASPMTGRCRKCPLVMTLAASRMLAVVLMTVGRAVIS